MNETALIQEFGAGRVSHYRRYLQMFVGEESAAEFVKYEVLTLTCGSVPGSLGYFLRKLLYPLLFRACGPGTLIGRGVVLRSPGRISIGRDVLVDDYTVLDAKGSTSSIRIGDRVLLGRNNIVSCHDATVDFGSMVSVGPNCYFSSRSSLRIGSNVAVASGVQIIAGGHAHENPDLPVLQQRRVSHGVTIEDGAWIGAGVTVLDGVRVGRNAIVGAGSVVSKDIPDYTIALGNPARVIQRRK